MKQKNIAPAIGYIVPPIMRLWIRKIEGLKNIPKRQACIIAPNHCSYIEHLMIGSLLIPYLNKKLHILAKKEHFGSLAQNTWHRIWSKYVHYISIDRDKGQAALQQAEMALGEGAVLLLYPEGTRSLTGEIQRGKTGIARLVLGARVPVVPVGFTNTFEILPKGSCIPRFKRTIIRFGKPLYFDTYYSKKPTGKLLREITDKLMGEIARLSDQTYRY